MVSQAAVDAGLSETLFARLEASTTIPVLLLNMQYRMHPAINRFPSAKFYGNKVKSGVPGADRPPPWGFPWPKQECPGESLRSASNGREGYLYSRERICMREKGG